MNSKPRIISVLGAECTGKTRLCAALGTSLPALVVPEYLRLWCDEKQRAPQRQEQALIIQGQLDAEDAAGDAALRSGLGWVVVDSSPLMTAIYSLEYFDDDTHSALALAHQKRYCLNLVADSAIQWIAEDWQRDSEQRRASAQRRLQGLLDDTGIEYQLIAGDPEQRLQRALHWIHTLPGF